MSTRGEELPNASIKLEDGTVAKKGCLFSFQNYEGDEDNSLYLVAITDKGYLKFLTEGAFGLDIKSQFHGKTHMELYLPLSVAAESLVCYSRGDLVNTRRITEKKCLPLVCSLMNDFSISFYFSWHQHAKNWVLILRTSITYGLSKPKSYDILS